MESVTDDTKVCRPAAGARPWQGGAVVARLRGWQLRTVAAAAMSPAATQALLACPLPAALVRALAGLYTHT